MSRCSPRWPERPAHRSPAADIVSKGIVERRPSSSLWAWRKAENLKIGLEKSVKDQRLRLVTVLFACRKSIAFDDSVLTLAHHAANDSEKVEQGIPFGAISDRSTTARKARPRSSVRTTDGMQFEEKRRRRHGNRLG